MDPQTDNDAEALKQRLNQLPPARPSNGSFNMAPASQSQDITDIDDSAFAVGADAPTPVPQPSIPIKPLPPAQNFEPVLPPEQPMAPPPSTPPTPPPAPAPMPTAPRPAAPAPPVQPRPMPAAPLPPQAMPPASPPPVPTLMSPPPVPEPAPPRPTAPPPQIIRTPAPTPAPGQVMQPIIQPVQTRPIAPLPPRTTPSTLSPQPQAMPGALPAPSVVSYQPPTKHVATEVVERIDETPQQNSKDIEALIEHNQNIHRLKSFASFLVFIAGVVIAAFLINTYIFQSYYVDGTSMTPTLQNDDRLIIDKIERTFAGVQGKPYIPQRGQIVVLDSSIVGLNGRDEQLIKRVIGLPGDTIIIKDGAVTIKNAQNPDGFDVNDKLGLKLQPTFIDSPLELKIPDGQVFVMGDNRVENGSYDSRAFGPVDAKKIVGRLWARILPLDKAQVF